uniref:Uncharacterized protein n=1 Tax=Plectus sambesii TaxID=2011161 RepID=A0A914WE55_9BILA
MTTKGDFSGRFFRITIQDEFSGDYFGPFDGCSSDDYGVRPQPTTCASQMTHVWTAVRAAVAGRPGPIVEPIDRAHAHNTRGTPGRFDPPPTPQQQPPHNGRVNKRQSSIRRRSLLTRASSSHIVVIS